MRSTGLLNFPKANLLIIKDMLQNPTICFSKKKVQQYDSVSNTTKVERYVIQHHTSILM